MSSVVMQVPDHVCLKLIYLNNQRNAAYVTFPYQLQPIMRLAW